MTAHQVWAANRSSLFQEMHRLFFLSMILLLLYLTVYEANIKHNLLIYLFKH